MIFLERKVLLEVLYAKLKHKERVLVNKRVVELQSYASRVAVITDDGGVFDADIVVGTDGVHSKVRKEMRRIASKVDLTYFHGDEESSEYESRS